jgi:hypothetical protein
VCVFLVASRGGWVGRCGWPATARVGWGKGRRHRRWSQLVYHLDPVSVSLLLSEAPAHTVNLTVSDTLKLAVSDTL